MKTSQWLGVLGGVSVCLACSGDYRSDEDAASVSFEQIVGGVIASGYPEAAYLNIDLTPSGGYACSGTLIAPKVVLTAGHCVDTHTKWEVYVGNAYRSSTSAAVYDWHEHGAETVNPAHHDLGLVFLSEPVALSLYPTIAKAKSADGTAAVNVGRVLNGAVQAGDYQAPTTLKAADPVGYPLDYYSSTVIQPGDSGGPVFLKGGHTLVAVNSGAGGGTQVLARVDLVYDWISAQIAAHSTGASGGGGGAGGSSSGTGGASGMGGKPGANSVGGMGGASGMGGKSGATSSGAAGSGGVGGKAGASGSGGVAGNGGKAGATSSGGAGGSAGKSADASAGTGGASGSGGKGGAASAGASGKGSVAGAGGSAASACVKETEVNDSFAQANVLNGSVCGALASATDADWYVASLAPGSHSIEVGTSSDVSLSLGVVAGATCVTSLNGVQRASVSVTGITQKICLKAASPGRKLVSYQISVN